MGRSVYQSARSRTRGPPKNLALAGSLVTKAMSTIEHFEKLKPVLIWFLENEDSTMLWGREVAKELQNYVVLDYCQCNGPGYRKRTGIAHSENLHWIPRPLCNPKACYQCVNGRRLKTAQQGKQSNPKQKREGDTCSLDTLHGLPRELCNELLQMCDRHVWQLI